MSDFEAWLSMVIVELPINFRVFSTVGPNVIVQGKVYKFSASAGGLLSNQTLIVTFTLSGIDANGKYIELNLSKNKMKNEMKNFVFNVSSLFYSLISSWSGFSIQNLQAD